MPLGTSNTLPRWNLYKSVYGSIQIALSVDLVHHTKRTKSQDQVQFIEYACYSQEDQHQAYDTSDYSKDVAKC